MNMKKVSVVLLGFVLLGLSSVALTGPAAEALAVPFIVVLTGSEEVPPVETDGFGWTGVLPVARNRMGLFGLSTFRLEYITDAHIHLGATGENGPVVVVLFDAGGTPVTKDGRLARGFLLAGDLVGPLEGEPFAALVAEIEAGNAYVNVHTVAKPDGEIRGQLRRFFFGHD